VKGKSFLTKNLNQHIPRYCGSCWAFAAVSCLQDRIKIAQHATGGPEISLSIQYILNCGSEEAGSCNGGSQFGAYWFISKRGYIPFETCQPYQACSADTCGEDFKCTDSNICRTCIGADNGGDLSGSKCFGLSDFPKATVKEYGIVRGEADMMAEIYARGPIACTLASDPIEHYKGGIFNKSVGAWSDHVMSVVGWGEEDGLKYWIARNSWGEYWGELGFLRVARGRNLLNMEEECAWAVPGTWTHHNFPCQSNAGNCAIKHKKYQDPSVTKKPFGAIHSEGQQNCKAEESLDLEARGGVGDEVNAEGAPSPPQAFMM